MIDMALSSAELKEILDALRDRDYASPALVLYLRGKEKPARYAEARGEREQLDKLNALSPKESEPRMSAMEQRYAQTKRG